MKASERTTGVGRTDRRRAPHAAADRGERLPSERDLARGSRWGLVGARGDRLAAGRWRDRDVSGLGRSWAVVVERVQGAASAVAASPHDAIPSRLEARSLLERRVAALAAGHGRPDPYAEELLARMDRATEVRTGPTGTKAIASSTARSPS